VRDLESAVASMSAGELHKVSDVIEAEEIRRRLLSWLPEDLEVTTGMLPVASCNTYVIVVVLILLLMLLIECHGVMVIICHRQF
jgi:hypothetical protein